MARARKKPIPITLVAGPRGAGKTTLINRLLRLDAFKDTAVILNDFGDVALENALVENASDGFVALSSGCVCCSVRGALTDGLENLLRGVDNGRIASIALVVIEADQAADPAAILGAIVRHPYLSLRFVPDGIVAVLRADSALDALAQRADTVRQVAMADVIAVAGEIGTLPLASLNPSAAIVNAAHAKASAFTGHGPFDPAMGDLDAWIAEGPTASAGDLPGEASRIRAFTVVRERTMGIVTLDRFVDYLSALQGPNLIRVRAVVGSSDGGALVVEGLGNYFQPPLLVDTESATTRFAVVARDLDRPMFEGYLDAFLNEARVDTPDREALTANPLAIAGFSARSGRR